MELSHKRCGDEVSIQNLFVCRDFGEWNVVGVTNLGPATLRTALHLARDLHLSGGPFAVYDYWQRRFLGIHGATLALEIAPMDTALLRITPLTGRPVIISTSRHITQGAVELAGVRWENNTLSGTALATVPGEEWRMAVYLPRGYEYVGIAAPETTRPEVVAEDEILRVVFHPQSAEAIAWSLRFNVKG